RIRSRRQPSSAVIAPQNVMAEIVVPVRRGLPDEHGSDVVAGADSLDDCLVPEPAIDDSAGIGERHAGRRPEQGSWASAEQVGNVGRVEGCLLLLVYPVEPDDDG